MSDLPEQAPVAVPQFTPRQFAFHLRCVASAYAPFLGDVADIRFITQLLEHISPIDPITLMYPQGVAVEPTAREISEHMAAIQDAKRLGQAIPQHVGLVRKEGFL